MDKSWMFADRISKEYNDGVESFLKFGLLHVSNPNSIRCPCQKCRNLKNHTAREIREHLYFNGVDQSYHTWIWHGEELPREPSTRRNVQFQRCNSESEEDEVGPSEEGPSTRKRMDKSWMFADRRSKEYDEGVEDFLKFGLLHASYPNSIRCPCRKCGNLKHHTVREIREHLYFNGVDQSYHTWIWHGELSTGSSKSRNVQFERCSSKSKEHEVGPSEVDPSTRKRMDKSWMFADRRSKEYDEGVEDFLKFGLLHASNPNYIRCPCRKCGNLKLHNVRDIREHLYFNGVDQSYRTWIWHGEELPRGSSTSTNVQSESCTSKPEEDEAEPEEDEAEPEEVEAEPEEVEAEPEEDEAEPEEDEVEPEEVEAEPEEVEAEPNEDETGPEEDVVGPSVEAEPEEVEAEPNEDETGPEEDVVGPSVEAEPEEDEVDSSEVETEPDEEETGPEEDEVGPSEVDPSTRKRKGRSPTNLCQGSSTSTNVQSERCNSEPEEDEVGPSEVDPSTKKRKGRGPTHLRQLVSNKRKGAKLVVEFNSKEQPFGKVATQFSSYLGVLGRKMVPISYATWKKVPLKLKDKIWSKIQMLYEVEGVYKTRVLSSIAKRWRTFKNALTTKFILPFKHQPEFLKHPPSMYDFIKQTHWEIFVSARMTGKWMRLSQLQKERRAKNIYNHCLSRKGYAGLEVELQHSSGTGEGIDRSVLWKAGRVNKKGEYANDAIRERAEKIDELMKQVEEGELSIVGSQDVLSLALETPEHPGRVRGVGHFVTPTSYFGLAKHRSSTDEMKLMKEKVDSLNETVEKLVAEVRSMKDHRQTGQGISHSEKVNCNPDSRDYMEKDRPGGSSQKGSLIKPHKVSSKQLSEQAYKPPTSVKSLLRYAETLMGADGTIQIPLESGVVAMESSYIYLARDDVIQFCKMKEITVTTIQAYMRILQDELDKSNLVQMYTFTDPFALSEGSGLKSKRARALAERMEVVRPGQFMLFPYNALGHWMLVVVDPHNNIVYFLDPTEHNPCQDLKNLILIAYKIWAAHLGKKVRNGLTWRKVKCPKQSRSLECGYYTMRYMKDIFGSHEHGAITNVFEERDAYTVAEIDEIRSEWALFVWQFCE